MTITLTQSDSEQSLFLVVKDNSTGQISRAVLSEDIQIGTPNMPQELMLTGRVSMKVRTYTFENSSHTVEMSNDDSIIYIINNIIEILPDHKSEGYGEVFLPACPRDGQIAIIKKVKDEIPFDMVHHLGFRCAIFGNQTKTIFMDDRTTLELSLLNVYGCVTFMWSEQNGSWSIINFYDSSLI